MFPQMLFCRKDLDYWLIDENWMDECCVEKYCGLRENVMEEMEITAAGLQTVRFEVDLECCKKQFLRKLRRILVQGSFQVIRNSCGI